MDGVRQLEVGLLTGGQAPQVSDVQQGQVAAHVPAVDFGYLQGVVRHQPKRIASGDAQLGEGGDHELQLALRALGHFRNKETVDQFARRHAAVDADQLELKALALGFQLRSTTGRGRRRRHRSGLRSRSPATAIARTGRRGDLTATTAGGQGADQYAEHGAHQIFANSNSGEHIVDSRIHTPSS